MSTDDDRRWVFLSDGLWHFIEETGIDEAGYETVTTLCNKTERWDHTFLDRMPEGEDTDQKLIHNGCLVKLGMHPSGPRPPKPPQAGGPKT